MAKRNPIPFTKEGLAELARIVKQVRAKHDLTYEEFGAMVGLSAVTIWKIESQKVPSIGAGSLAVLSSHLGYSMDQLIAIGMGHKPDSTAAMPQTLIKAEDVFVYIQQMARYERMRLKRMILASESKEELLDSMQAVKEEIQERWTGE